VREREAGNERTPIEEKSDGKRHLVMHICIYVCISLYFNVCASLRKEASRDTYMCIYVYVRVYIHMNIYTPGQGQVRGCGFYRCKRRESL